MSDPTDLLADKIAAAERAMAVNFAEALYGGAPTKRLTPEQEARQPGYYWTRYPGQEWSLDLWGHGCWTYMGFDEISTDDPPEIVGPIEPPAPR